MVPGLTNLAQRPVAGCCRLATDDTLPDCPESFVITAIGLAVPRNSHCTQHHTSCRRGEVIIIIIITTRISHCEKKLARFLIDFGVVNGRRLWTTDSDRHTPVYNS